MRLRIACLACLSLFGLTEASCARRDRMCVTPAECAPGICVAGRCALADRTPAILEVGDGGAPAVKRLLLAPVDLAYLAPGAPAPEGSVPAVVTLGKEKGARLLLKFEAPMPESATVVEAYLLLPRAESVDVDPVAVSPISLHVLRVVDPWDSRSIRWATQPRTLDVGASATVLTTAGRPWIRLDVRELVSRWPQRQPDDQGLALVASETNTTGMAFATTRSLALEIYLKP